MDPESTGRPGTAFWQGPCRSSVFPNRPGCEYLEIDVELITYFLPQLLCLFVGYTKGGVKVEPAIRRAAPSRNSDQSVGIDSLCCWRLERYTPDHYLTSIRKKSHTCHLLHNSRRREHHENPNQGKWRSRSWQNSDLVSTGSGHQTPPWGYILSQY